MKKKIILGLGVYSLFFLLCGVYIVIKIQSATSSLDKLITLHQVEILREHYLIQVKKVQTDLTLKDTRHKREFDTFVLNVVNMGRIIDTCFDCHHSGSATERLTNLKRRTDEYKEALSRVLTVRANRARLLVEEDAAFRFGEELIDAIRDMISITSTRLSENTQRAMGEIAQTKYLLYLLVGIGPLLSALLGYVFISGLTRPVGILVESTRKLKSGDLDHRVETLRDEFGELATSFNEMAGSLKEQMEKMQRTEQMVVAAELAAGLAHEIKNPLAGIKIAMNVLSDEANISPDDKEVLRKVVAEVGRLETLMKNFLNFTKPPKPRPETVNVHHLLNTTLAFYLKHHALSAATSSRVEITRDFQPVPLTMADPMLLQQVFLNIVLNAIHAMPGGGTLGIRTTFEEDGQVIAITISDTGKGVGRELLDKIFLPFFTTKAKGTGLGLAISKRLVEQHGGTISVESLPGSGTSFTIRVPAVPVEEMAAE